MSGGGNTGKSNSQQGANFSQNVWSPQGGALQNLYGNAANTFGGTSSLMNENVSNASNIANNAANTGQQALDTMASGGAYGGLGLGSQLMSSLNQSMNSPSATQEINNMIMGGSGNNYADAMKETYINDANKATQNMLGNLDARAAASGMSGGSRHGTAISKGMEDINSNLQRNLAETGYNTFDKDLERKLQIAGQADSNNLSRQKLMSDMLGAQNTTMNNAVNAAGNVQNLGMGTFAPLNAVWDSIKNYADTIGAPTVLSSGGSQGNSSSKGGGAYGSAK